MPDTTKKGPLSAQAAAAIYAIGLNGRLRDKRGWRSGAFQILQDEYDDFARMAVVDMFCIQDMWEYAWLVQATNQYLKDKKSKSFSNWFFDKVRRDLSGINERLKLLDFDEQEKANMAEAFNRMAPLIESWVE